MSKLKDEMPMSKFALPEKRKYPIENQDHARNAKSHAAQRKMAGNLSAPNHRKVDARADKVLKGK